MLARSSRYFWILAALFLFGGHARAAQLIHESDRSLESAAFDDTARLIRYAGWGAASSGAADARLLLTLTGRDAVLTITLPGRTVSTETNAWFREVADRIGWSDASLSRLRTPGALTYRAERFGGPETTALGRSRIALDLAALRGQVSRVAPGSAFLGVRCTGADNASSVPVPVAAGHRSQSSYLYFDLKAATSGGLLVRYGTTPRFTAAVLTSYLLILLTIPMSLGAIREILLRRMPLDALGRLTHYRRWMPRALLPLLIGTIAMLLAGTSRFVYLLSTLGMSGLWLFWLLILPFLVWNVAGRWVGAPLQRAVLSQAFDSRAEFSLSEIRLVAGGVGAMLGIQAVWSLFRAGTSPLRFGWVDWAVLAGCMCLCVALARRDSRRSASRTSNPVFVPEPEAPEAMAAEVIRTAVAAGYPIERVVLRQPFPPGSCTVFVTGRTAALPAPLVDLLPPEQWGILTVASVRPQDLTQAEQRSTQRLGQGSCLANLITGTALIGLMFANHRTILFHLSVLVLAASGLLVWGQFASRRTAIISSDAQLRTDLRVAERLPEPQLLVKALRALEEAAARTLSGVPPEIATRREALERALGIEEC